MKIVVFGLSISSAWGNGHATLLRGLFRSLSAMGHTIHFYERDTSYYAAHRDASTLPYVDLHLYQEWAQIAPHASHNLSSADAAIITSYCPDARSAAELLRDAHRPCSVFYDMDTPVTFETLDRGEDVPYLPVEGLGSFDLVLSYTGGEALAALQQRLGAKRAEALYGWVDPDHYFPSAPIAEYAAALSYLGTYSADRQAALEALLIEPARCLSSQQFLVAGALYPSTIDWPSNVKRFDHVNPNDHRAFYSSSPLALNVTRGSMAAMGYCPSGRLFEATACGAVVLSDRWEGLDMFFEPGSEILLANSAADAVGMLNIDEAALAGIARRARERTLDCHTAQKRARQLLSLIEASSSTAMQPAELQAAGA